MANNNYYNPTTPPGSYTAPPQFFPQPQGNVFFINNTLEVANIPVSAGVSVALCMPEGIMYLKSLQNGNPVLMAYNLTPYTITQKPSNENQEQEKSLENRIKHLEEHLDSILRKLNTGGKISEQL